MSLRVFTWHGRPIGVSLSRSLSVVSHSFSMSICLCPNVSLSVSMSLALTVSLYLSLLRLLPLLRAGQLRRGGARDAAQSWLVHSSQVGLIILKPAVLSAPEKHPSGLLLTVFNLLFITRRRNVFSFTLCFLFFELKNHGNKTFVTETNQMLTHFCSTNSRVH